MEKNLIEVNGTKLFCVIAGEGFPLVFLHGNDESHEFFAQQIAYFQKEYQVIALDTRAHGNSQNDGRPLSTVLLASDLKEVLDTLGITKTHIVGFSDGGNTALQFASAHYEYVDKLIAIGANTTPKGLKFATQCSINKDYYEAKIRSIFLKKYHKKANILQLMRNHPNMTQDDLSLIRAKTLLIAGEHDVITNRHLKYLNKHIAGSLLQIIPNASHFLIQEYPDLFNQVVDEFLQVNI